MVIMSLLFLARKEMLHCFILQIFRKGVSGPQSVFFPRFSTEVSFVNLPEKRPGRLGLGITSSVMKECEWVEPVLVAQVKFTEWTSDDQLRQPVFLGLRNDKQAKDVVREPN